MSTIKSNNVQVGQSATATQNFTITTGTDGTGKVARGNVGATTQDVITIDAAGKVDFPAGLAAFVGANQNLSSSGYQKFPGGFVVQWGSLTVNPQSTAQVSFSFAFPAQVFGVVMSPSITNAGTITVCPGVVSGTLTTSGFTCANTNTQGATPIFWVAIGH